MEENINRIVELCIDLEDFNLGDMGVDVVSLVTEPAIAVDFMAFSKQEFIEPKAGESEDDFIGRCIPVIMNEGKQQDEAIAICYSYWEGNAEFSEEQQTVLEWAQENGAKLVVFGRSLGGIAATHLGATKKCDGLILESTFTNMGAMARAHYPLPFAERLLNHRLNAVGQISRVRVPILFFHGDNDRIVPIRLGRELYEAAPTPKEFVVLPGAGHNDTYLIGGQGYFNKIEDFFEKL